MMAGIFYLSASLEQGWQITGHEPNSDLPRVFANEAFLEYSQACWVIHVYGCFHATMTELNTCSRNLVAHSAQNINYLTLYREFA